MYKCTIRFQWAIPEKIQTLGGRWGGGGEDIEFPRVLKKEHVEVLRVN